METWVKGLIIFLIVVGVGVGLYFGIKAIIKHFKGCTPDCDGKTCGDDGCGKTCPSGCSSNQKCNDKGTCDCVSNCGNNDCGDDGCGGICGICSTGKVCKDGMCTTCITQCSGKTCGDDGCGGSCGPQCPAGQTCKDGNCKNCTPDCANKVCGDDGCGGTCPTGCSSQEKCEDGKCVTAFPNQCGTKNCGDDGHGNNCGTCSGDTSMCYNGTCVKPCSTVYYPTCSPTSDNKNYYIQVGGDPAFWNNKNGSQYCVGPNKNECRFYSSPDCSYGSNSSTNMNDLILNNVPTNLPVCQGINFVPQCVQSNQTDANPWYIKVGGDLSDNNWSNGKSACLGGSKDSCYWFPSQADCITQFNTLITQSQS